MSLFSKLVTKQTVPPPRPAKTVCANAENKVMIPGSQNPVAQVESKVMIPGSQNPVASYETVCANAESKVMIPGSQNPVASCETVCATSENKVMIPGSQMPALRKSMIPDAPDFRMRKDPADHTPEERALRDQKVEFVRAVWETHLAIKKCSEPRACAIVAEQRGDDFPLLLHAGKGGTSALRYNNYRNWINGYGKKPGLGRLNDGTPNYRNADVLLRNYALAGESENYGDPAFWTAITAAFLNGQHWELAKEYRVLELKWQLEYPAMKIPTLGMVRYRLKQRYPERMALYFSKGENWYDQHVRVSVMRDPRTIRPNEAWVADTQDCDFIIKVPGADGSFEYLRPKICVLMDVKSQHLVSIQFVAGQVTNDHICAALAWGIAHYGRPRILLTDNGRDYLKQGFAKPVVFTPEINGSERYEHSILKSLDIQHRVAKKYNGRSKYVERFFEELAKYSALARGYVGNKPENRPASAAVWMKPGNREFLWDEEQACRFLGALIDIYHRTPKKDSRFLNGLSPEQAFAPELRFKRTDMTVDEYLRAFQRPELKPAKLDWRGPSVRCGNLTYVADHADREKFWPYDRQDVMIKFDPGRRDCCHVWTLAGQYIGRCSVPELLPYFDAPREQLQDAMRRIKADVAVFKSTVREATGNWHLLDPATVFQQPREALLGNAPLHLLDTRYSVKGETHNPKIYIPKEEFKNAEALKRLPPPAPPAPSVPADEEISTWMQPPRPEPDDELDMADVHKFMVNHKQKESEDEL